MTAPSRRDVLKAMLAGCAASALPRPSRADVPAAKPHYFVQIFLDGGFDSVLCVDAKDAGQKGNEIDCGYRPDERRRGRQRLYGPSIGALLRHEADMTLVHGVHHETVSHGFGQRCTIKGTLTPSPSSPLFGNVIGSVLPGTAPIPSLMLLSSVSIMFKDMVNEPLAGVVFVPEQALMQLKQGRRLIEGAGQPRASLINAAHQRMAGRTFAPADPLRAAYDEKERQSLELRRLLAGLDPSHALLREEYGPTMLCALEAIRLNVAKFMFMRFRKFDSHIDNLSQQRSRLDSVFSGLAAFIDLLKTERNAFGSLFEQTTIVVHSELGRFPRLNAEAGKDHWPENSWILFGKGIRRQDTGLTIGGTDLKFRGLKIDYQNGSTTSANVRPILLDAMFATLVKAAGGDPRRFGYERDMVLDCLLSAPA